MKKYKTYILFLGEVILNINLKTNSQHLLMIILESRIVQADFNKVGWCLNLRPSCLFLEMKAVKNIRREFGPTLLNKMSAVL